MERDNITAEWARKTSQGILGKKVNMQIDNCLEAIEMAVTANKLSIDVSMYVEDLTIQDLQKRGFSVKKHSAMDQRETDYITIKW
jgi:hypothetical protein